MFSGPNYSGAALVESGDNSVFTDNAFGVEKLRRCRFWKELGDTTGILGSAFENKEFFWYGNHV